MKNLIRKGRIRSLLSRTIDFKIVTFAVQGIARGVHCLKMYVIQNCIIPIILKYSKLHWRKFYKRYQSRLRKSNLNQKFIGTKILRNTIYLDLIHAKISRTSLRMKNQLLSLALTYIAASTFSSSLNSWIRIILGIAINAKNTKW